MVQKNTKNRHPVVHLRMLHEYQNRHRHACIGRHPVKNAKHFMCFITFYAFNEA